MNVTHAFFCPHWRDHNIVSKSSGLASVQVVCDESAVTWLPFAVFEEEAEVVNGRILVEPVWGDWVVENTENGILSRVVV